MYQDHVQIRSNCLVIYAKSEESSTHTRHSLKPYTPYSGTVTESAKKKLLHALDMLVQTTTRRSEYCKELERVLDVRLTFTTLTIPPTPKPLEPSYANPSLLEPYLRYFRDKFAPMKYVWKAEFQKNQQLHYHLATDKYIPWKIVRWKWNKLLKEEGHLDSFAKQYGHFNPPSTEIKAVVSVRDAKAYIAKEIVKSIQNQTPTTGKIWDCSKNLESPFFSTVCSNGLYHEIIEKAEKQKAYIKRTDNCLLLCTSEPLKLLPSKITTPYRNYIYSI